MNEIKLLLIAGILIFIGFCMPVYGQVLGVPADKPIETTGVVVSQAGKADKGDQTKQADGTTKEIGEGAPPAKNENAVQLQAELADDVAAEKALDLADKVKLPDWQRPEEFWQRHYHKQVNRQTFLLSNYAYYFDGATYPTASLKDIEPDIELFIPTNTDPNSTQRIAPITPETLDASRMAIERCCDAIHKWRSLNESEGMAMEIVRTVELTKTDSNIYSIKPELAVQSKRILGQINRTNKHFDLTSRIAIESILTGHIDRKILSRMEKQIADLEAMLARLGDYNDLIGIELGIGRIDRSICNDDTIQYTGHNLPNTEASSLSLR